MSGEQPSYYFSPDPSAQSNMSDVSVPIVYPSQESGVSVQIVYQSQESGVGNPPIGNVLSARQIEHLTSLGYSNVTVNGTNYEL